MSEQPRIPTDEQRDAINARAASIVLSSGAGCGKTAVLTARYLSHLMRSEAAVGELAAITFTERAAREMRGRIRDAIVAQRQANADTEIWDGHLRDLEIATISTIHAFCTSLLRQHALTAGIDPRFEVLDDAMAAIVRSDVLKDSIDVLLTTDGSIADDLRKLIESFGSYEAMQRIEGLRDSGDPELWAEWLARSPAEIAAGWKQVHGELVPRLIEHALTTDSDIDRCVHLLRSTPCHGPKMRANIATVLGGIDSLASSNDPRSAIAEIASAARVKGTELAKAWADDETYHRIKDALEELRDALPTIVPQVDMDEQALEQAAAMSQRLLRVVLHCRQAFQLAKRHRSAIDFTDQLLLARNLIRDHPDVQDALRRRYRFLLLDELQDTDPVQMEVIQRVCGGRPPSAALFAVGDEKQSIYRFRGADVRQFEHLREQTPKDGRFSLTENFRSQPGIIRFVNALFQRHIGVYEPLSAQRPQCTPEPCVEFLWSIVQDESAGEARERDAGRIAQRIARMVGNGERIVVDETTKETRPARLGDITILFRSMTNVAIYERAFVDVGLDYHLIGGRAFFAQQEVYDWLNLLRTLENPHDSLSLAGTLRSPFCGLSDDALVVLATDPDGLWTGLHDSALREQLPADDRPAAERALRFLDGWRRRKDRVPIARLMQLVLDDCGYDAALQFEKLGDRKLANLWKLIEMARQFDRAGEFGLAEFIRRLGDAVGGESREEQAATLPQESDVLRLMSIHQAKGEEFPIVILPDLTAKTVGHHRVSAVWDDQFGCVIRPPDEDDPLLFSKAPWDLRRAAEDLADWHETLRIFYVACTRARDHLVLSGPWSDSFKPKNVITSVLTVRFDPRTGACCDDAIPRAAQPKVRLVPDLDGGRIRLA